MVCTRCNAEYEKLLAVRQFRGKATTKQDEQLQTSKQRSEEMCSMSKRRPFAALSPPLRSRTRGSRVPRRCPDDGQDPASSTSLSARCILARPASRRQPC
eukprot:6211067-Pleurochrysis_carterae.AAC.4